MIPDLLFEASLTLQRVAAISFREGIPDITLRRITKLASEVTELARDIESLTATIKPNLDA